mgnify:CR=1 FL=1
MGGDIVFPNLEAEQARNKKTNQNIADYLAISRPTYEKKKKNGKFTVNEGRLLCKLFKCEFDYLFATENDNKER